eukprot:8247133-Lingulodinium_polyedra.AAC.1
MGHVRWPSRSALLCALHENGRAHRASFRYARGPFGRILRVWAFLRRWALAGVTTRAQPAIVAGRATGILPDRGSALAGAT